MCVTAPGSVTLNITFVWEFLLLSMSTWVGALSYICDNVQPDPEIFPLKQCLSLCCWHDESFSETEYEYEHLFIHDLSYDICCTVKMKLNRQHVRV